jgi:CSLREA domain-containing protein
MPPVSCCIVSQHSRQLAKYFAFSLLLFAYGSSVWATTITVNSTSDAGPGNCTSMCTLRDAFAGAAASGDTIGFALSLPNTITLTQGELVIGKSITVQGPGAAQLVISAGTTSRVFNVTGGSVVVIGLTVRDGSVTGGNGSSGTAHTGQSGMGGTSAGGGCISVGSSATLLLRQVDLRNCTARGGSGGDAGSGTDGDSFTNGGDGGSGGSGAQGNGGAISVSGSLSLLDSSVTNAASYAGVGGHGGDGGVGGVFAHNGNGGMGGAGGYARGGAIFVDTSASLWIENTTIASNHADAGNGGTGGAATSSLSSIHGGMGGTGGNAYAGLVYVAVSASIIDLEFSTLANGNLTLGSGGLGGSGGGSAQPGSAGVNGASFGNAVSVLTSINATSSAIVGGGPATLCDPSNAFVVPVGAVNLDQDSSCTGFTKHGAFAQLFLPLNLSTAWPGYMPVYHSVVIDAAANCNDLNAQPVSADQHGTPRPQGSQCDIGAIEADYIFLDGFQ